MMDAERKEAMAKARVSELVESMQKASGRFGHLKPLGNATVL